MKNTFTIAFGTLLIHLLLVMAAYTVSKHTLAQATPGMPDVMGVFSSRAMRLVD